MHDHSRCSDVILIEEKVTCYSNQLLLDKIPEDDRVINRDVLALTRRNRGVESGHQPPVLEDKRPNRVRGERTKPYWIKVKVVIWPPMEAGVDV
jgi:hypothetical protein